MVGDREGFPSRAEILQRNQGVRPQSLCLIGGSVNTVQLNRTVFAARIAREGAANQNTEDYETRSNSRTTGMTNDGGESQRTVQHGNEAIARRREEVPQRCMNCGAERKLVGSE